MMSNYQGDAFELREKSGRSYVFPGNHMNTLSARDKVRVSANLNFCGQKGYVAIWKKKS